VLLYFFSSGLTSLGDAGVVTELDELVESVAEPAAPAAPVPVALLLAEPVSAGGVAGAGVAGVLAAGGGVVVVVVVSSFLQAVRPSATRATRMSERFIFIPL
jgi:hypothetical protein